MAMNQKISDLTAAGEQVYHLGFGEARFPVHPKILAAFHAHATERSYSPVIGLPELRANVAEYYKRKFNIQAVPNRVMIGAGSKSLLYAAMAALEGDVLLPVPSWVSYDTHAYLTGKQVTWVDTRPEDNYCLTAEGLEAGLKLARANGQIPRIIVLNSPSNPTGAMIPPQMMADLMVVAKREDLVIISDEIYAETAYGDIPHASPAHYYPERTIITGGLSKHLSLGGWRLGVAIIPNNDFGAELYRYMTSIASNIWTTASAPIQYAAIVAYSNDPDLDEYVKICTTINGYVTGYLYDTLTEAGVPCAVAAGGFYVYPDFAPWREVLAAKHDVHTSADLANFLLAENHLATLPGSDFGAKPSDLTLRLATSYLYALTEAEAENLLTVYQQNLPREEFLRQACPNVVATCESFKSLVAGLKK